MAIFALAMPKVILLTPHYLPNIAYFTHLLTHNVVLLEAHGHYEKRSYRNRCYILGSLRVERLTVPVQHSTGKTPYKDIKIDYSTPWPEQHWQAICTAYGKAPFFLLADPLHDLLHSKPVYLLDLNLSVLRICLKLLQWPIQVRCTTSYAQQPPDNITNQRTTCVSNTAWPAHCHPIRYQQTFGRNFIANLSIIDLLFCVGPNASQLLRASIKDNIQSHTTPSAQPASFCLYPHLL